MTGLHQLRPLCKNTYQFARNKQGIALAWVVLWMPIFIVLTSLTIDIGMAAVDRALLRAASDLGALAGVQELDLDQLAVGVRYILPGQAEQHALQVTQRIINNNRRWQAVNINVWVFNPPPGGLEHPISGRTISDPTVTVQTTVRKQPILLRTILPEYELSAYADASVLPRRD